jgi:2,4-dienoyl-CoA reductase-like NADH-dependent reductase (Old Yellow Enzyme family)
LIRKGEADIVTLGKGAIANHDWVNKLKNGEALAEFKPEYVLSPNAKIKEFEV